MGLYLLIEIETNIASTSIGRDTVKGRRFAKSRTNEAKQKYASENVCRDAVALIIIVVREEERDSER